MDSILGDSVHRGGDRTVDLTTAIFADARRVDALQSEGMCSHELVLTAGFTGLLLGRTTPMHYNIAAHTQHCSVADVSGDHRLCGRS